MKAFVVSLAAVAATAGVMAAPAAAQDAMVEADGGYSLQTPIAQLMADEEAAAVVSSHFPSLAAHPMYESFKGMSLTQLAAMSNGQMTQAQLDATAADLAELDAD